MVTLDILTLSIPIKISTLNKMLSNSWQTRRFHNRITMAKKRMRILIPMCKRLLIYRKIILCNLFRPTTKVQVQTLFKVQGALILWKIRLKATFKNQLRSLAWGRSLKRICNYLRRVQQPRALVSSFSPLMDRLKSQRDFSSLTGILIWSTMVKIYQIWIR